MLLSAMYLRPGMTMILWDTLDILNYCQNLDNGKKHEPMDSSNLGGI